MAKRSKSSKRTDEDRGSPPILGIEASAYADELSVSEAAGVNVRFTGRGKVVTRRKNLPPGGAESGGAYRHASAATRIHALSPDEGGSAARGADEAGSPAGRVRRRLRGKREPALDGG